MISGPNPPTTRSLVEAFNNAGVPLTLYENQSDELLDTYECPLVLVRPDGHVAWRGTTEPDQPGDIVDRVRGALPAVF